MSSQITKTKDEIIKLINNTDPDNDLPKKLKRLGKKLVKLLEVQKQSREMGKVGGSIIDSEDIEENYDKYVKYKTKYLILKRNSE